MSGQRIGVGLAGVRALYGRLQDYFGVWAIEPKTLLAAAEHVRSIDLVAHVRAQQRADLGGSSQAGSRGYAVLPGSIALIEASGTLMKAESSLEDSTSTVSLRQQFRAAAGDPNVAGVLFRIDSPGGTVSGTADLAADVAAAAAVKPVYTYAEDLCCSAAYWVGSQATKMFANATCLTPCIGTYMAVEDLSGKAEQEGVKVHVIRAGEFKGAGTPGTQITDEQLAEWQRVVDGLNEYFLAAVASGRKLSLAQVRQLADGRVHVAQDALKLKLLDGVQSLDATLAQLQKAAGTGGNQQARAAKSKPPAAKHAVPKQKLRRDVEAQYLQLVAAYAEEQRTTRAAAALAIARKYPNLHAQYRKAVGV